MVHVHGWYQVAFERELTGTVAAAAIGDTSLILVRTPDGIRAFDAFCPHRGAHLAFGGRLDGEVIVCPFHGRRIRMGCTPETHNCIREHRALAASGLVFVLMSGRPDHGFAEVLSQMDRTHVFVPGFTISARVPCETVIENAFDRGHFRHVHGLAADPELKLWPGEQGELAVRATFVTAGANPWQKDRQDGPTMNTPFLARVYSPGLCLTELGDDDRPFVVITAATPAPGGGCVIRVSVAVRARAHEAAPGTEPIRALLRNSRQAFDQDLAIWENLSPRAPARFGPEDDLVLEFHRFCRQFAEEAPH